MLTEPAPAKLNLALHVRHRRPDGYHELETLFAFCRDGDMIDLEPAPENVFTITGPFAAALTSIDPTPWADNLVTRAADAFAAAYGVAQPHRIALTKNLPIASGIGGGSADAAATLRALARLHSIPPTDPTLSAVAAHLGADVPACLDGRTTLGRGRGDTLEPVGGLPGTPVLLVNSGVPVSTVAVFARWDGIDRGGIVEGELLARARVGRNDLEPPARELAPAIDRVLHLLATAPGVLLARMSGSGATCFALFESDAARAATADTARAQGWWSLETALA